MTATSQPAQREGRWRLRLAAGLGAVCAVGAAAVLPYQLALLPEVRAQLPLPVPLVMLVSGLQSVVIFGVLAWIGLRLGGGLGLGAPALEAWARGQGRPRLPARDVALSLAAGFGLALALGAVDHTWLLPLLPESQAPLGSAGPLLGLLASIYGSVNEEVLLRLFLTTALAWLGARVTGSAGPGVLAVAVLGAAVLFGVGHLPMAAKLWPLTPLVVARVVALNAVFGLLFGWLYVRHGLERAMVAHLGADLALHVALPALGMAG